MLGIDLKRAKISDKLKIWAGDYHTGYFVLRGKGVVVRKPGPEKGRDLFLLGKLSEMEHDVLEESNPGVPLKKAKFSLYRRLNGIRHNTSKKEERHNSREMMLVEDQFENPENIHLQERIQTIEECYEKFEGEKNNHYYELVVDGEVVFKLGNPEDLSEKKSEPKERIFEKITKEKENKTTETDKEREKAEKLKTSYSNSKENMENLNERDAEYIIDRLLAKKDTDGKIKKIRPDYVFYDNSDSPILVLEVKKPNVKLYECLEKAKKVCKIINAPLAVASDAFKYFSYHLTFNREYLINNRPLEDLPSPQELSSEKLMTNYEKKEPMKEAKDQNLKTIINNELKRHQQYYKIGKYASSLKIRDAVIIKEIIEEMNKIDFAQSDFDAKGVIFEYFLKRKGKNDLAQYFTPRTIVRFMVNYLSPKFGEKVYDPFCGSGGMLIEAFNFIRKQAKTLTNLAEQNNQNANVECDFCQKFFSSQLVKLISEQNKKICEKCLSNLLKRQTFYGKDKATVAYVAKLNMILSGDGHNNIHRVKDTLKEKVENKYEVVITNIPFNMATKFGGIYKIPSNDANAICVQHCLEALKKEKGSRAGIIVPDKFTFFNGYKDLRKKLFEEFTVTVGFTLDALKEPINENDLNDILLEKFLFTKITKEQLENNQ
ncbi:28736_t:CDS:2 [Racocetra persica]|uniref:28736_t:CDS:1 n=1 Tax=Racocetra persica TaxID=160502 RepID=A0ACA9LFD2_9GLOM|nr:28736_t:CDS:2 [Racocetra persica]